MSDTRRLASVPMAVLTNWVHSPDADKNREAVRWMRAARRILQLALDPRYLTYRGMIIHRGITVYAPWEWAHDEYDGAPDAYDTRSGQADTIEECMGQIDEWWEEQDD